VAVEKRVKVESLKSRAREREPKNRPLEKLVVFYYFLDHVTKTQMLDIQTDQSEDYNFPHCIKGVPISRPPMYTHLVLQTMITTSTYFPLEIPNSSLQ